jgi:hypothetical protein
MCTYMCFGAGTRPSEVLMMVIHTLDRDMEYLGHEERYASSFSVGCQSKWGEDLLTSVALLPC